MAVQTSMLFGPEIATEAPRWLGRGVCGGQLFYIFP